MCEWESCRLINLLCSFTILSFAFAATYELRSAYLSPSHSDEQALLTVDGPTFRA